MFIKWKNDELEHSVCVTQTQCVKEARHRRIHLYDSFFFFFLSSKMTKSMALGVRVATGDWSGPEAAPEVLLLDLI